MSLAIFIMISEDVLLEFGPFYHSKFLIFCLWSIKYEKATSYSSSFAARIIELKSVYGTRICTPDTGRCILESAHIWTEIDLQFRFLVFMHFFITKPWQTIAHPSLFRFVIIFVIQKIYFSFSLLIAKLHRQSVLSYTMNEFDRFSFKFLLNLPFVLLNW